MSSQFSSRHRWPSRPPTRKRPTAPRRDRQRFSRHSDHSLLWPGTAPEAKGAIRDDIPALTLFEPRQGAANGSAVIIFPGGCLPHSGWRSRGPRGGRLVHRARLPRLHPQLPAHLARIRAAGAACSTRGAPSRPSAPAPPTTTSTPTALWSSVSRPAATWPRSPERSLFPATPTPTIPSTASPAGPTSWSSAIPGSAPFRATPRT